MPIIRRKLDPADVYPVGLRYNADTGQVQTLINGTWTDSPNADPRNVTTLPGRITSHPACDAAESVKDAFKRQIDGIITLIAGSNTAFSIAGAILALFEFGPWGVLIVIALAIAHTMLDAGATALTDALTDTVYHTFMCILDCHMDNTTGQLMPGSLGEIDTQIDDLIGGLGAVILKAMVGLAGEAGINNLASIGTSTGDCSDCDCTPPCDISGWTLYSGTSISKNVTTGHWIIAAVHDVGLYGGWGCIFQSGDDMACCRVGYVATVGGISVALKIACGGAAYPTGSFSGGGISDENRSILFASTAAFTVDVEFDP